MSLPKFSVEESILAKRYINKKFARKPEANEEPLNVNFAYSPYLSYFNQMLKFSKVHGAKVHFYRLFILRDLYYSYFMTRGRYDAYN